MLLFWVEIIYEEVVKYVPLCGIVMNQSCKKVLLVLTQLGFQTFNTSTLPNSFFPSRYQTQWLYTWSRLLDFTYLNIWSLHRKWNPDWPEVATVILLFRHISNSNSSFSKTTAVKSCIRFWIDAFILLQAFFTRKSLVLFRTLAWSLPLRSPSTTFFSQKCVSFFEVIDICSIYHFSAALKVTIAVWLHFFFI